MLNEIQSPNVKKGYKTISDVSFSNCVSSRVYTAFESARGGRGIIPRRLRRLIAFIDTPLLCGGVVHLMGGHRIFLAFFI